ncbi:DUF599 domain-containing protein [Sulfitobacter aestuariivivens]|uniref:DUF599 domain-containing protein n=1 Tax=Sulfitobacter aestuariivivens TaxID=2766981 RepID=A0A927D4H6_9RHOB|nr:DUF599 domain-containing protein [Sulfitobacter aestuariivivens]MBD3664880.1 DUF599 domain-containing protein [Sulfitobacter aestuariivivens]
MNWLDRIALFEPLDFAAVALIFAFWAVIGWRVEHPAKDHLSVSRIMAEYRREWMRQMITREPRIFDAQTVATLRQGTSFLASTCVIAIGGTLALIGNAERVAGVAEDLTLMMHPAIFWEIKLLLVVFFLTNAFLKFIWSNRLFGYCSVVMAAVPNDPADPQASVVAEKAGELNITAARSFNRGLRSMYFSLTSLAWLAGAIPLILAAFVTLIVIWRREFASHSRAILLVK